MIMYDSTITEEITFTCDDPWDYDTVTFSKSGEYLVVRCSCDPNREYVFFLAEEHHSDLVIMSVKEIISRSKDTEEMMRELRYTFQHKYGGIWVA